MPSSTYLPHQRAYLASGGRHATGCTLGYFLTTQPSGRVRLDCYKDGLMVMSTWNLSPIDAQNYATHFMQVGNLLDAVIKRRIK
jgi:hypothetical protein